MITIHVDHAKPSAAKEIIREWMDQSVQTLADYDIAGHMALISKEVRINAVPKLGSIDYKGWAAQVEHEFTNKVIKSVAFHGDFIRAENAGEIMFVTREVITATDGKVINNNLEVVLRKEEDGVWRVIQERFMDESEARHFGLI